MVEVQCHWWVVLGSGLNGLIGLLAYMAMHYYFIAAGGNVHYLFQNTMKLPLLGLGGHLLNLLRCLPQNLALLAPLPREPWQSLLLGLSMLPTFPP